MSEAYLYVRSKNRSVLLVVLHENLAKNCQALATQAIVEVVPTQPFIFKMED